MVSKLECQHEAGYEARPSPDEAGQGSSAPFAAILMPERGPILRAWARPGRGAGGIAMGGRRCRRERGRLLGGAGRGRGVEGLHGGEEEDLLDVGLPRRRPAVRTRRENRGGGPGEAACAPAAMDGVARNEFGVTWAPKACWRPNGDGASPTLRGQRQRRRRPEKSALPSRLPAATSTEILSADLSTAALCVAASPRRSSRQRREKETTEASWQRGPLPARRAHSRRTAGERLRSVHPANARTPGDQETRPGRATGRKNETRGWMGWLAGWPAG